MFNEIIRIRQKIKKNLQKPALDLILNNLSDEIKSKYLLELKKYKMPLGYLSPKKDKTPLKVSFYSQKLHRGTVMYVSSSVLNCPLTIARQC